MWLTGNKIREEVLRGRIKITPFHDDNINPNSYNYTLFPVIKRIKNKVIDLKSNDSYEEIVLSEKGYVLKPGECYLGSTNEIFSSNHFASLVTGRSSIGRKFITNHITAGLIDQGFNGRITLEITVQKPTRIYPNIPFGQIFWFKTVGDALLYNGKYQNQIIPEISKVARDLEKNVKKKKAYIVFSEKNGDFNFENDFYLKGKVKKDKSLVFNSSFKKKIQKLKKENNLDRVELTGGEDPLKHKDINKIIDFLKKEKLLIKVYTKGNKLKKIKMVDEINIVSLDLKGLIKKLKFYRGFCKKLRVSIPLTKDINSKKDIKKIAKKLNDYCDEIVFRPLTRDFKNYNKLKPSKIVSYKMDNVKYDKIEKENPTKSNVIILPSS